VHLVGFIIRINTMYSICTSCRSDSRM